MRIHDVMLRWLGGLVLTTGALLAQQEPDDPANTPELDPGKVYIRGVEVAKPVGGRPAEEMVLVGLEADGNGFRHRTPVLGRADRTAGTVDREALRARRLAMYEAPAEEEGPPEPAPIEVLPLPSTESLQAKAASRRRPVLMVLVGMLGTGGGLLVMWLRHNRVRRR